MSLIVHPAHHIKYTWWFLATSLSKVLRAHTTLSTAVFVYWSHGDRISRAFPLERRTYRIAAYARAKCVYLLYIYSHMCGLTAHLALTNAHNGVHAHAHFLRGREQKHHSPLQKPCARAPASRAFGVARGVKVVCLCVL